VLPGPGMKRKYWGEAGSVTSSTLQPLTQKQDKYR